MEPRKLLSEENIVLLGYGAQGKAEAENLRKSGIPFTLGLRANGPSYKEAESEGFKVQSLPESLKDASTVVMNLPDHIQARLYQEFLEPLSLRYLIFAHGLNTHFKLIPIQKKGPLHLLVAPKGAANGLQKFYGTSSALPALLAARNSEGPVLDSKVKNFAEAYALSIGCHPQGLLWVDFKDEAECDLFSEQALLCGGVSSLLRTTYEVMVEAGYNREAAYFESLFELKLIVDLIWERGITGMRSKISPTARYGDITRGDFIIDSSVKERMNQVLKEIQSGKFTQEFLQKIDSEEFLAKANEQKNHPLEKIGIELRNRLGI